MMKKLNAVWGMVIRRIGCIAQHPMLVLVVKSILLLFSFIFPLALSTLVGLLTRAIIARGSQWVPNCDPSRALSLSRPLKLTL